MVLDKATRTRQHYQNALNMFSHTGFWVPRVLWPDKPTFLDHWFIREYEGEAVLCVANLSRSVQPIELDLSRFKGMVPVEMLGLTEFPRIGDLPYFLTLSGYGFYWFRLQQAATTLTPVRAATSSIERPSTRNNASAT